jgi:uncharacterized CHY-type Zn-finger protein
VGNRGDRFAHADTSGLDSVVTYGESPVGVFHKPSQSLVRLHFAHETDSFHLVRFLMAQMTPTVRHVRGVNLDPQSRCEHYRGPYDIVAIKMKCCGVYYACKDCHAALADHETSVWPESQWDHEAILCGACGATLTILQYMQSGSRCATCGAQFNPGCRSHYHLYFQVPKVSEPR